MKKFITAAFILAISLGAAQAQTGTEAGDAAGRHHKGMKNEIKALHLTADQKNRLKSFHEEQKAKMAELKAQSNLTAEEQKTKHKEIAKQYRAKFQAILTEEQKAQLAAARHKGKKDRGNKQEGQLKG